MNCCTLPKSKDISLRQRNIVKSTQGLALEFVDLPRAKFLMGSQPEDDLYNDGEGQQREVAIDAFSISKTCITNASFKIFIEDTGYITDAEQSGNSFVFHMLLPANLRKMVKDVSNETPWWYPIANACWKHPEGEGSHIENRLDHPVAYVSHNDA